MTGEIRADSLLNFTLKYSGTALVGERVISANVMEGVIINRGELHDLEVIFEFLKNKVTPTGVIFEVPCDIINDMLNVPFIVAKILPDFDRNERVEQLEKTAGWERELTGLFRNSEKAKDWLNRACFKEVNLEPARAKAQKMSA
jgi:hypothetical protein